MFWSASLAEGDGADMPEGDALDADTGGTDSAAESPSADMGGGNSAEPPAE